MLNQPQSLKLATSSAWRQNADAPQATTPPTLLEQAATELRQEIRRTASTQGLIQRLPTYDQTTLLQLLTYYLQPYRDIELITALSGTDWQHQNGIDRGIAATLAAIHRRHTTRYSRPLPHQVIIPINIGGVSGCQLFAPQSATALQLTLPNNATTPVKFNQQEMPRDGHCGFHALQVSRDDFAQCLQQAYQQSPAPVSQQLYPEIYSAFDEGRLDDQTARDMIAAQRKADEVLNSRLGYQKEVYLAQYGAEHISQQLELSELYDWILSNDQSTAAILENNQRAVHAAEQAIRDYCARCEVVERYINAYRQSQWLGLDSALLYAKQQDINLYVWQPDQASSAPSWHHQSATATSTHYLYYLPAAQGSHFNRLQPVSPIAIDDASINAELAHEIWLFIGIRYTSSHALPGHVENVTAFDPRQRQLANLVTEQIQAVFPTALLTDISRHFDFTTHSGAWVVEIARQWRSNPSTFPCLLSEALLLAQHQRALWILGQLRQPSAPPTSACTGAQERWFTCLSAAIKRGDLNYVQTFLASTTATQQRQRHHLAREILHQHLRLQLYQTAAQLRNLQWHLLKHFSTQQTAITTLDDLNQRLATLGAGVNPIASALPLSTTDDAKRLADVFEEEQISEQDRLQGWQQTLTEQQQHASQLEASAEDHAAQAARIKTFIEQHGGETLPKEFQHAAPETLIKQVQQAPLYGDLADATGTHLLDIAIAEQQLDIAHWLGQRGVPSQLFERAVTAVKNQQLNALLLILASPSEHSSQSPLAQQQRALLHILQGPLDAQIILLQKQQDALQQFLTEHPGQCSTQDITSLNQSLDNIHATVIADHRHLWQKEEHVFMWPAAIQFQQFFTQSLASYHCPLPSYSPRADLVKLQTEKQQQQTQLAALQQTVRRRQTALDELHVRPCDLTVSPIAEKMLTPTALASLPQQAELRDCQLLHAQSVDQANNSLLHHAFAANIPTVIRFLLQYQIPFTPNLEGKRPHQLTDDAGNTPLHHWISAGRWEPVEHLLAHFMATDPSLIDLTISNGAGIKIIDCTDPEGNTVLHHYCHKLKQSAAFTATLNNFLPLLKILFAQEANLLIRNHDSQTVIDMIASLKLTYPPRSSHKLPSYLNPLYPWLQKLCLEQIERNHNIAVDNHCLAGKRKLITALIKPLLNSQTHGWDPLFINACQLLMAEIDRAEYRDTRMNMPVIDNLRKRGETDLLQQRNQLTQLLLQLLQAYQTRHTAEIIRLLRNGYDFFGARPTFTVKPELKKIAAAIAERHRSFLQAQANRVNELQKYKNANRQLAKENEALRNPRGRHTEPADGVTQVAPTFLHRDNQPERADSTKLATDPDTTTVISLTDPDTTVSSATHNSAPDSVTTGIYPSSELMRDWSFLGAAPPCPTAPPMTTDTPAVATTQRSPSCALT